MLYNLTVCLTFFSCILAIGLIGHVINHFTGIFTKLADKLEGSNNEDDRRY